MCLYVYIYLRVCVHSHPENSHVAPDNLIKQINVRIAGNREERIAELSDFRPRVTDFFGRFRSLSHSALILP